MSTKVDTLAKRCYFINVYKKKGIYGKIKNGLSHIATMTGIYTNRLNKLEKLLQVQTGMILSREAAIQNMVLTTDDYVDDPGRYSGNKYKTYNSAVTEIKKKYICAADWGVTMTGPVIDFRASLISGGDIEVETMEGYDERDNGWVDAFLDTSGLKDYRMLGMTVATEMEGRLLWKIKYDKNYEWYDEFDKKDKTGMVRAIPILWVDERYEVTKDEFGDAEEIVFSDTTKGKLKKGEFIYRKFGGLPSDLNNPVPKVWRCLDQIETVEKVLRDSRQINHLFAGPRPHFECETYEEAVRMEALIRQTKNWKLGAIFAHTGKFLYTQPDVTHSNVLTKEFYTNVQVISAVTGLPVHWLSLVDLMSNRSTADDLGDVTELAVSKERQTITSAMNELLKKAAIMQSESTAKTKIDYTKFKLKLNIITDEQWRHLKDIFMPAAEKRLIPKIEFLRKVPGIDADKAYELLDGELKKDAAFMFKEPENEEIEDVDDEENVDESSQKIKEI